MEIKSLDILLSNMPKKGQARNVSIQGEQGASFILQIVDSAGKFYDFVNNSFVTGHVPRCNLKGTISGGVFTKKIQFPAVGANTTYNLILVADPSTDTTISSNRQNINKGITQVADTIITLAYNTANTANYSASPPAANVATTLSNAVSKGSFVSTTATLTNATTQAGGFGLKLDRQPVDSDFVFISTTTLDTTTSSSKTLFVDTITDISAGMFLVSGPNLSGAPQVLKVEDNLIIDGTARKRLTLSSAQTLNSDGATLTFHARGSKDIALAIGLSLSEIISSASIPKTAIVEHKIVAGGATTGSDATLHLDATSGIGKTASIKFTGLSSGVTVSSVSANAGGSGSAGTIEMSSAQNLSDADNDGVGFLAQFGDFFKEVNLSVSFAIEKPGTTDRTITLLLDNFITPGAAS